MNKLVKNAKPSRSLYLLAFLIPVLIMLAAFIVKGIYPFGPHMFLRTDLYHQYAPFTAEFLNKLHSGGSLAWSWNIGGGTNFLAVFAYYLADPFNWLLRFLPREHVIEFISYLVVLKTGFCGLTFSIFLTYHGKERGMLALPFSWAYALSAFVVAYSWNIMWMNSIVLAPLVLMGIEKLVREQKPALYCITLAVSILMNFYIAIMLCIFIVLWFIVQMIVLPTVKIRRKTDEDGAPSFTEDGRPVYVRVRAKNDYAAMILRFILYSIIAGGMAAVLLLPEYLALQATASASSTFPHTFTFYFDLFRVFARHSVAVTTEQTLNHWPNIYCGAAVFLLLPLYFASPKTRAREKIAYLALLAFLLLSFSVTVLNYIWHGFHYPNSLPARQSFLYIAVVLVLCYEAVRKLRRQKAAVVVLCAIGVSAFLAMMMVFTEVPETPKLVFAASIGLVVMFAMLTGGRCTGVLSRRAALVTACIVLAVELFANLAATGIPENTRANYLAGYDAYESFLETAEEDAGGAFYRVEKDQRSRLTRNDGAWLNYRAVSVFSSTASADVGALYRAYGSDHSVNAYSANGMTEILQALLGVRYVLTKDGELANSQIYTQLAAEDGYYLYRNEGAQSLGFMADEEAYETIRGLSADGRDPFERQSAMIRALTGIERLFFEVPAGDAAGTWTQDHAGMTYAYVVDSSIDSVTATVGGQTRSFTKVTRGYLLDLGYTSPGTEITLTDDSGEPVEAVVKTVNDLVFRRAMDRIGTHGWVIDEFTDTRVGGMVTADRAGRLIVTIPYDAGWSVTVNGRTVDPEKLGADAVGHAYYAISLDEGTHHVVFTYRVRGLREGSLISLGAVILFAVCMLVKTRSDRKAERAKAEAAEARRAKAAAAEAPQAESLSAEPESTEHITEE